METTTKATRDAMLTTVTLEARESGRNFAAAAKVLGLTEWLADPEVALGLLLENRNLLLDQDARAALKRRGAERVASNPARAGKTPGHVAIAVLPTGAPSHLFGALADNGFTRTWRTREILEFHGSDAGDSLAEQVRAAGGEFIVVQAAVPQRDVVAASAEAAPPTADFSSAEVQPPASTNGGGSTDCGETPTSPAAIAAPTETGHQAGEPTTSGSATPGGDGEDIVALAAQPRRALHAETSSAPTQTRRFGRTTKAPHAPDTPVPEIIPEFLKTAADRSGGSEAEPTRAEPGRNDAAQPGGAQDLAAPTTQPAPGDATALPGGLEMPDKAETCAP